MNAPGDPAHLRDRGSWARAQPRAAPANGAFHQRKWNSWTAEKFPPGGEGVWMEARILFAASVSAGFRLDTVERPLSEVAASWGTTGEEHRQVFVMR